MVLLSSSAFGDPILFPFVQGTLGKPPASLRAAVVTSASPLAEPGPNAVKTRDALLEFGVPRTEFVDWTAASADKRLHECDLIVLNGGDPFRLLATAQRADLLGPLRTWCESERVVIGVSAGGMILSPGLQLVLEFDRILGFESSEMKLEDPAGLGLFDEHFFPHFDLASAQVANLGEQLHLLEANLGVRIHRQANGQTTLIEGRVLVGLPGGLR